MIGIGLGIIYQGYRLIKSQKEMKKDMNDMNIEFSAMEGTGIELVKKNYPNVEMKDDFRQKTSEPTPHSTSNHLNDPSEMQKKAFEEENK